MKAKSETLSRNDELVQRKRKTVQMGGSEKLERIRSSGALNARERIDRLVDKGSFFEVGMLNHSDIPGMEDKTPADGKICGIGRIDSRPVLVKADDVSVLAGSGGRIGSKKARNLMAFAIEKGHPIVNLGEAGGARLPDIQGADGLSSMTIGVSLSRRMRQVPMASAIFGECYGNPSWHAAFSDFVVQVKGSCMAVVGPRVLEVAAGEQVSKEELGGWRVHAKITGLVDRAADTEAECLDIIREFLSFLPSHAQELPPRAAPEAAEAANARQANVLDVVPTAPRRAYNMHDLIKILVDHQKIFVLKPDFDKSLITCLARLDGHPVGIIATNPMFVAGAMGPDACDKAASFICLCDSFNIPLVFLHDSPGFFVTKGGEHKRMPGKIINFVEALVLATVPKIAVVVRKSYGMAYSNLGGSGMGSDFVFAWPSADMSFMSPEVAVNVISPKSTSGSEEEQAEQARRREALREELYVGSAPWRAAGLGYLDDVIAPEATRKTLIEALQLARGSRNGGIGEHCLAAWPTSF